MRCILVRLANEGLLFDGIPSNELLKHGAFTTRYVSLVDEYELANQILQI